MRIRIGDAIGMPGSAMFTWRSVGRDRRQGGSDMNWEAVGAIGEMVGATGVILSLVYLAALNM